MDDEKRPEGLGRQRFLRYPDLRSRGIPYSAEHLARLEKAGKFPAKLRLSHRCIVWIESEIDEWMRRCAAERGGRAA